MPSFFPASLNIATYRVGSSLTLKYQASLFLAGKKELAYLTRKLGTKKKLYKVLTSEY